MARGVNSVVRIKKQTAINTAATFTATDKLEVTPFTSETFKASVKQISSQALRRAGERQKGLTRLGTLDVGGSVSVEPTNNALANLLPLLFSNDSVTNIGTETAPSYAKKYVITASDHPYATIIVDDGEVVRAYANNIAAQWSINATVDQLATMSIDWVGTHFQVNSGGTAAAWTQGITGSVPQPGLAYVSPTVEYGLYFDNASLQIGVAGGTTVDIPVNTASLQVSANAVSDRFKLGSRFRRDVPTGIADITGSFTLDANLIPGGASGLNTKEWAYQAITNNTFLALKLVFVDPTNEYKTGSPSKLEIILPYVFIDSPDWNVSGPDIINGAINFTSYADGANGLTINHYYKLDT